MTRVAVVTGGNQGVDPPSGGGIADIAYRDVFVRTPAGWRIKDKSTHSYR